jgi:hypothetical protein
MAIGCALEVWAKALPKHQQKLLSNPLPFRTVCGYRQDFVENVPLNLYS